jgi:hypothetical protein
MKKFAVLIPLSLFLSMFVQRIKQSSRRPSVGSLSVYNAYERAALE